MRKLFIQSLLVLLCTVPSAAQTEFMAGTAATPGLGQNNNNGDSNADANGNSNR
ncbi:MAG TPA: hypothetical protein VGX48_08900 [Pyrinomonadaceae bacterium]|nr:hypothetical protein [Pyrinomonadaceae bacterium]